MRQGRANARLPSTLGKPSRVAALFLDSEAACRDGSRPGLSVRDRPPAGATIRCGRWASSGPRSIRSRSRDTDASLGGRLRTWQGRCGMP